MKKIIAILLCISALFALGACGRLTEAKSESVKPEVYFTEDKSGTYTDSVGNVYNYSYKIPAFSGGSEDAERINKYFDDTLRPIVEDELAAMEDELSLMTGDIKCEVFESGDVRSRLGVLPERLYTVLHREHEHAREPRDEQRRHCRGLRYRRGRPAG